MTARYLNSILASLPRTAGGDRLLPLPAARRVDRARPAGGRAASSPACIRRGAARRCRSRRRCARRRSDDEPPCSSTCAICMREYHMGDERVHAAARRDARDRRAATTSRSSARRAAASRTLLNLLGVHRPADVGHGDDRRRARRPAARRATRREFRLRRIGFVFQRFYLMPALTARENVELPMAEAGLPARSDASARARVAGVRRTRSPRASIARRSSRAASSSASRSRARSRTGRALLLADEPTGELDAQTGAEMIALFERLNARRNDDRRRDARRGSRARGEARRSTCATAVDRPRRAVGTEPQ